MAASDASSSHGERMDGIYRWQRHIYDLTRKYYLLGRDGLIADLDAKPGHTVLELGCGTGRNLILAANRHPRARLFGLDISSEMLATARASIDRAGLAGRIELSPGDATSFDGATLFGIAAFDRIFISYSLSMIPGWERAITAALAALKPGGELHIVDFGRQEALPSWFRTMLRAWLARFHVTPRDTMRHVLESECQRNGATLRFRSAFRGYAVQALLKRTA